MANTKCFVLRMAGTGSMCGFRQSTGTNGLKWESKVGKLADEEDNYCDSDIVRYHGLCHMAI